MFCVTVSFTSNESISIRKSKKATCQRPGVTEDMVFVTFLKFRTWLMGLTGIKGPMKWDFNYFNTWKVHFLFLELRWIYKFMSCDDSHRSSSHIPLFVRKRCQNFLDFPDNLHLIFLIIITWFSWLSSLVSFCSCFNSKSSCLSAFLAFLSSVKSFNTF